MPSSVEYVILCPPDPKDVIGFCPARHVFVREHNLEETNVFPMIEKAVGEKGLGVVEVAQLSRRLPEWRKRTRL